MFAFSALGSCMSAICQPEQALSTQIRTAGVRSSISAWRRSAGWACTILHNAYTVWSDNFSCRDPSSVSRAQYGKSREHGEEMGRNITDGMGGRSSDSQRGTGGWFVDEPVSCGLKMSRLLRQGPKHLPVAIGGARSSATPSSSMFILMEKNSSLTIS